MKVRNGFVSNSSSSSFCIYGVNINTDFDTDILTEEAIKTLILKDLIEDEKIKDNYEAIEAFSIPFIWCGEEGYIALGNSPWSMMDNETKLEFQNRVKDEIKEYFKLNDFRWYCEEYQC